MLAELPTQATIENHRKTDPNVRSRASKPFLPKKATEYGASKTFPPTPFWIGTITFF